MFRLAFYLQAVQTHLNVNIVPYSCQPFLRFSSSAYRKLLSYYNNNQETGNVQRIHPLQSKSRFMNVFKAVGNLPVCPRAKVTKCLLPVFLCRTPWRSQVTQYFIMEIHLRVCSLACLHQTSPITISCHLHARLSVLWFHLSL